MRRSALALALLLVIAVVALAAPNGLVNPAPARAGVGGTACSLLGTIGEGWWGKACNGVLDVGGKVVSGAKKVGKAIGKVAGNPVVQRAAGIAAIVAWVLGGAKWTMDHMASVISSTTSPSLNASWFTGVYLRIEGLALFFTLLFICAAAAESVLRSDGTLVMRAVFGYLPLAALVTALATPLTMLLLAATDEMSAGLAGMAGQDMTHFLTGTSAWVAAGLTAADPFFAVMAGGFVVAAGGALWIEMLIREIAVYVVVALLPVVFAGMVWPARRVWAVRAVEVLVALILSKVAIVAVLALGGAALAHSSAGGISRLLGGLALIVLGAFTPWLLLRLIPLAEVASAAVGHIRGHVHAAAGLRTPEATLASKASDRVQSRRNRHANGNGQDAAAGGVAIGELLEQMHRRARTAQQTSERRENGDPSSHNEPVGHGEAPAATARRTDIAPLSTPGTAAGERDETMVQRPDGSWEPLPHADPDAPIPAPPWDETDDGEGPPSPPVPPDPHDDPFGGPENDGTAGAA